MKRVLPKPFTFEGETVLFCCCTVLQGTQRMLGCLDAI